MKILKSGNKGFSVIESVVYFAVFLTLVVSSAETFRYCQKFASTTEYKFAASNYAREYMERAYWDGTAGLPQDSVDLGNGKTGTRNCDIADSASDEYKVITTTINWGS